jgi:acyl-CoA reductase-like NAD-dependent aldehyde dehydrogenase
MPIVDGLEIRSPYNGELIETVPMHNQQEAIQMLGNAKQLFNDKSRNLQTYERISIFEKLIQLVSERHEEFSMLIAKEGGKPITDARVEVTRAIGGIKLAIQAIPEILSGEEIPMNLNAASAGRHAYIIYEPKGVIVAISAFNHPLNLIIHQVIPAIAVGCPVIVKPSLNTPLSCIKLVGLLYESGLPQAYCQICVCDDATAELLATSDTIAFLSFIGSAKVGWYLRSQLAAGVSCALEHGGVAPVIIDKTVDIDAIIPAILKGGFYHAGQVCVSVQRVYVHEDILLQVQEQLVAGTKQLVIGDPTKDETDIGCLITEKEVERVNSWIQESVSNGAELLCGGRELGDGCYDATILLNPEDTDKVSTHEIFAPVICLYSYKDISEAVSRANNSDFSFQAAIFTSDMQVADYACKALDAATVVVNDHTAFRVDWMPFGGRKHSGYGVGGINYSMKSMVQHKLVVRKH